MAASSQPGTTRFLGESWASWSPEDADQSTCIDSDDEIYPELEMDFPSSNPSIGPDNAVSFNSSPMHPPPNFAQDASLVSIQGPELIMPSIHEDYAEDGSWFFPRPSDRAELARNSPSRVPTDSTHDNRKQNDQVLPNETPSPHIKGGLGNHRLSKQPLLVGVLLLFAAYLVKISFSSSITNRASSMQPASEMLNQAKPPRRYQLILDSRARLGQIFNPSNEAASVLPMLLKDSESEVGDLCSLWAADMGSKHELEFECNNTLVGIRQIRELVGSLLWRLVPATLDDIDRELARIKRLIDHSSVTMEWDSMSDRIMAALHLHLKRPTSKQAISEVWYKQAETAFELAVSKQVNQISYLQELLNLFHTHLQPISDVVSNSRSEEETTRCGSHYLDDEGNTSLASFLKNIRCTVAGSLALLSFSPEGRRPANYIRGEIKRTFRSKLERADVKQQTAAIAVNTLVTQLREIQRDWEERDHKAL
ncbi:hypothetical protein ACJ72_07051 [Emergomyces africanus]|uniref:Uncharacterized protein n=1 Tax=Emergomyces africanus TaxID=1955775 RepID=A0A1B7NPT9_9EURO|nr:hypothetical protein ACJ72_07051 [Emergomyces africanus]